MTDIEVTLLIEARRACKDGSAARLREQAGLTRSEMARLVGVTPAAVSRWESAERRPTGEPALAYARALRQLAREIARA
jgi:transcriptional regulator with XRE-family HTH domain